MNMRPDSPIRLALWLVIIILSADGMGTPIEAIAGIAVLLVLVGGWLIIRRRKIESSKTEPLLRTNTPLYTYGLLGFGLASALGILGLASIGFDVLERVITWDWDEFAFRSLYPLVPALILATISICSLILHVIINSDQGDEH